MVDHYMVYVIGKVNAWRLNTVHENKIVESRNMKNYDKTAFQQDLNAIDWKGLLEPFSQDPSKMASVFHELFNAALSLHAHTAYILHLVIYLRMCGREGGRDK